MKRKANPIHLRLFAGFLFTLIILSFQTNTTSAQGITLNVTNTQLADVLREIQKQSPHTFVYNNSLVDVRKLVTVKVSNEEISKLMDVLLAGTDIVYRIVDNQITLSPKEFTSTDPDVQDAASGRESGPAADQPITITGTTLDQDGLPLAGATVRVKGIHTGAFSDADGRFVINVPSSTTVLVFSYIGYEPQEVLVGAQRNIDVILQLQDTFLNEVVVTGYQTISRDRSSGSFTKPNEVIIQDRAISNNIVQRLEGLVPGFTVNLTQGSSPGANRLSQGEGTSNQFIIRGIGSIQSERAPLYVVNGIVVEDLSLINPNDVENITVLKDATASSIWGSRAANGVVVITTKVGTRDEKIRVQYDAFYNFQGKPDYNYWPRLSSAEFIQTAREFFDPVLHPWTTVSQYTNRFPVGVPPHEVIMYQQHLGVITEAQANVALNQLANTSNNEQIGDLFYRNQSLMNQTISVTGGSASHSFYGSFSHTNNQSYVPGEKNNQYNLNVRQDFSFNKRVKFFLITDLANSIASSNRVIHVDNRALPYQLFKEADGNTPDMSYMTFITTDQVKEAFETQSGIDLKFNPVDEFERGLTQSNGLTARVTAGAKIRLFEGLNFEGTYGYSRGTNRTTDYDAEESFLVRSTLVQFTQAAVAPSTTPTYFLPRNGGIFSTNDFLRRSWTIRNQLVYDASFNDYKHQITVLAGQEAQEYFTNSINAVVRGYNPSLLTSQFVDYRLLSTTGVSNPVAAGATGNRSLLTAPIFSESEMMTRVVSYYTTGGYTYDSKYTLNASLRTDQSNLFGADKSAQSRPVWSVGAKWLISGENFMDNINWINTLALRSTYGITGNAPVPGSATSHDVLVGQNSAFAPGPGLGITTYANRVLSWERTENVNIGIDFGLIKQRVYGSIDYYTRKTTDLIGQLPVNFLAGTTSIVGNFGDMNNKGLEVSLTTRNIVKKNFFWQSILNFSHNKNTITKLAYMSPITDIAMLVGGTKYYENHPALSIFAYNWAGLDEMGDPQIFLADGTKYKEASTGGIDLDAARFVGSFQPVWNGGFMNFFGYKNFTLSSSIIFNMGHYGRRDALNYFGIGRFLPLNYSLGTPRMSSGNVHSEILDRWKNPGDELHTDVPAFSTNTSGRNTSYYILGSNNVYDASYIKLRDITLSYTLPNNLFSFLKYDEIRFRLQLANVMLWKANQFDLDPEFMITDNWYNMNRRMPVGQGAVTFGVNIKF